MNKAGKERTALLAQKEYSQIEYRNRLVRMQNMDCICHCSAEIDLSTLLYFSVNDFYLGQGEFVLLLFSEISENSTDQQEGRDVFGRMFTYAIVEEIAKEVFTGHHSFYSSELDGRLVMILNFPFGIMPDRTIVDYLDVNCAEVTEKCKTRYDMNVVTYISEPVGDVRALTGVYTALFEAATLHRYTRATFPSPAVRVASPAPTMSVDRFPSAMDSARELVSALLGGRDYHAVADKTLASLAGEQADSANSLKRLFGDYFEAICLNLTRMGAKIKTDALRAEQYRIAYESVHWCELTDWLHRVLDTVREEYSQENQRAARQQFDMAIAYIRENLADPSLTIEKCAAGAGCSVSALSKAFHRQMNTSAAKYIREQRLTKALELLQKGCSVGKTCTLCGFGSTETFHRAFKEKYGVTPGQMRGSGEIPLK